MLYLKLGSMKNAVFVIFLFLGSLQAARPQAPRIVNVINFVRQTEPRYEDVTDEVIFDTTVEEVNLLKRYGMKGTFLLQYDALVNPRYQELFKSCPDDIEVGAWWEITQPHVEACGLTWRGRYPWDWHADVGFSTGYAPQEREKLADVYMAEFKRVFGAYPKSVGSWFIDAHTLRYLREKYHIEASCTCKDQIGTDGYTLWGGYWNQAYYPSRNNAFMPAQTEAVQIDVPVFRMLGSDPIYQYDCGLGKFNQPVVSMEPVYKESGGSKEWVEWFMRTMADNPCLAFAYVQAGQENSFTWEKIKDGLCMQTELLDSLQKMGKIRIQTLAESGRWFKENFRQTPATAVVALDDYRPGGRKTVWYDSRFYRANMLWQDGTGYVRDIHLFDENVESGYLREPAASSRCVYATLPLVDGHLWSTPGCRAGMFFVENLPSGESRALEGDEVSVEEKGDALQVRWKIDGADACMSVLFAETSIQVQLVSSKRIDWALELKAASEELPFRTVSNTEIESVSDGHAYRIRCGQGRFVDLRNLGKSHEVWRIEPVDNQIVLNLNR